MTCPYYNKMRSFTYVIAWLSIWASIPFAPTCWTFYSSMATAADDIFSACFGCCSGSKITNLSQLINRFQSTFQRLPYVHLSPTGVIHVGAPVILCWCFILDTAFQNHLVVAVALQRVAVVVLVAVSLSMKTLSRSKSGRIWRKQGTRTYRTQTKAFCNSSKWHLLQECQTLECQCLFSVLWVLVIQILAYMLNNNKIIHERSTMSDDQVRSRKYTVLTWDLWDV